MKRIGYLLYGVVCYGVFLATFLYLIAFVEAAFVPRTIDAGGPGSSTAVALVIDALLLSLFGVQHSVMARRGFKQAWTRIVPEPIERSTYVLFTSLCLIALFHFWRPIPYVLWDVGHAGLRGLLVGVSLLGWGIVLVATFLINHFDLFGLRQVWLAGRNQQRPSHPFRTPLLYKLVRHPIYLGFIIAFWVTPTMTVGHLVFAVVMLGYILIAIQYEERDLMREYGDQYVDYRQRVRGLVPLPKTRKPAAR
jgi:protein-S-isoprenylcysteine O-methyltransferase Ste14